MASLRIAGSRGSRRVSSTLALLLFGVTAYATPPEIYHEWVRSSEYVTVRDQTRLAIDIYRPAVGGVPVRQPLPVILIATPYHRAELVEGSVIDFLTSSSLSDRTMLAGLLRRGYVIASLDIRGRGASFGTVYGAVPEKDEDRWDLFDTVEWLAARPWSDGQIGMLGCSYLGRTQYMAAEVMPPHLKAIAPCGAGPDFYGVLTANGIPMSVFYQRWDEAQYRLDVTEPAPRVDADTDGTLLRAAIIEHRISWDKGMSGMVAAMAARPFRNSKPSAPEYSYGSAVDWNFLANFRISKIAILEYAGWRDLLPEQALAWYRSMSHLGVPQKLIIGPWYHCEWYQSDLSDPLAEHLRWFDYWLKGIKNGAADLPNVRYFVAGAPAGREWRTAAQWPLPNEQPKTYYLGTGRAIPGHSLAAGRLTVDEPRETNASDEYLVDYTTSTVGMATRWRGPGDSHPNSHPNSHPGLIPVDTSRLDALSLTYTSAPLEVGAELTGFPSVRLWVRSTAKDQDFFVYLEEVDEIGRSTLMSEGAIRASNRATRDAPFDNQGLPWHPGLKEDQTELIPGVPVKIELALYPMSNYIKKGHRLRVTINNDDQGQWDTPVIAPAPTVSILRDRAHPSSIILPFIAK